MTEESSDQFDAIIIGAGIAGLYQLYRLRELGMSVRVFEAGSDVGGTWYWNRYPGARFDSESYSYGYSFSKELLEEWEWKEHFSGQPENLKYVNYVADKFDLRRDIQFDSMVKSCHFDETRGSWTVTLADGSRATSRYLITAIGVLSVPVMPVIDGIEGFEGESFHTGEWPHEPVDFHNKRVAIIGTGATGVQAITEIAKTVGHLTVFQRTPNYCAPLHNGLITSKEQAKIKASYDEIFAKCKTSHGAFIHNPVREKAVDQSPNERESFYEKLYSERGFGIWMGNYRDIMVDETANETISQFIKNKIRERVKDPAVAEKLIPHDHGFGTRRLPLESGYFEVYNQDNVKLVDVRETPIERVTAKGVQTSEREYEFDYIIYATGFDAVLGAFNRIDFQGVDGVALKDKWVDGPRTFLGIQVEGFPNMFTLVGPHNAATFCNIPRCIEQNVEWVTDLLQYMQNEGHTNVATTKAAEGEWTEHVHETSERLLFTKVDSWFMGINPNLKGRDKRKFLLYAAGAPKYNEMCDEVAASGYKGFTFTA
ncbi:MAG: flavin-containing monooxygenase [Alphaproteobacteria bacterium]